MTAVLENAHRPHPDHVKGKLTDLLTAAVVQATGLPSAKPRPGQLQLSHDIVAGMASGRGRSIGEAPTGVGKALDVETPVPTPTGWTTMGELSPGDTVFNEDGQIIKVIGCSPVMVDHDCYEVSFSDGTSIVADAEHLWASAPRRLRQQQAERRRVAKNPGSIRRAERVAKLEAILENIRDGGYMLTAQEAADLTAPATDRKLIDQARTDLGLRVSPNEKFDFRPVLAAAIETARSRSSLLSAPEMPPYVILTTEQMANSVRSADGALNHAVPASKCVNTAERDDLPIDPWLFGYWLGDGDGDTGSGVLTVGSADLPEISRRVSDIWPSIRVRPSNSAHRLVLGQPRPDLCPFGHDDWTQAATRANRICQTCRTTWGRNPLPEAQRWNQSLTTRLRKLGTLGDKHIPREYRRASARQRLQLLAGLLDSDGSVSGNVVELTLTNSRLAQDALDLVRSLGITARITESDAAITGSGGRQVVGRRWRITFTTELDVFTLVRKREALDAARSRRNPAKHRFVYVTSIRPVPSRPVRCIAVDTPSRLFLAGRGWTPTHNTLAYLSAAALMACEYGERTVVSTESLSLQAQIIDKDGPTVVSAAQAVLGKSPKIAVLKGWSNFACGYLATVTAHSVLDQLDDLLRAAAEPDSSATKGKSTAASLVAKRPAPASYAVSDADATGVAMDKLIARLEALDAVVNAPRPARRGFGKTTRLATAKASKPGKGDLPQDAVVEINGRDVPAAEIVPLLLWSVRALRDDQPGDRNTYPVAVREESWSATSVSPAECLGVDACPFGEVCRSAKAKDAAAEADVVVTNHSMLAMQATTGAPVVIGSRKLGTFRHIVVDEAHGLPQVVRNQGASQVSGARVHSAIRALDSVLDAFDKKIERLFADGRVVADALDMELSGRAALIPPKESVLKLTEGDPVASTGDMLEGWVETANSYLSRVPESSGAVLVAKMRAKARLAGLREDLDKVREHRPGVARWIEAGQKQDNKFIASRTAGSGAVAKLSPVEVGGLLAGNVWTGKVLFDEETGQPGVPEADWVVPLANGSGEEGSSAAEDPKYPLSVAAVSATLTGGSGRDFGLRAQKASYPSPFDASYGASVLCVPRAVEHGDVEALRSPYGSKPKLDTKKHPAWALAHMERLIEANGGKALVLAATAEGGKFYADQLAKHANGRWRVHSQWGETTLRQTVAEWKADTHSVLVGTRSLMTGTDAPGETCSLVIVDRIPRAAGNPVDDARVEALMEALSIDKWSADALVYASDAASLLEQSAGRLIRSVSDNGMVAVLDPRLLKVGPFSYAAKSREIYLFALRRFATKVSRVDEAVDWLSARRTEKAA